MPDLLSVEKTLWVGGSPEVDKTVIGSMANNPIG